LGDSKGLREWGYDDTAVYPGFEFRTFTDALYTRVSVTLIQTILFLTKLASVELVQVTLTLVFRKLFN